MRIVNILHTVGITGTTEANSEPEKKTVLAATCQPEVDLRESKN